MYCTIEDIQNLIPAMILSQLTNSDDLLIAKAIQDAQATINAYLQGAYNISEISESALLKDICQKISVYNLYSRFSADETPQIVSTNYKIAIGELEKIQSGKLSLGLIDGTPEPRTAEIFSNKNSYSKTFSIDTLAGF